MAEEQGTWVLPGYVAEELIGFGASGEVWRGRATDTGERVALKRLRAGAADRARRRLEREAALLATIDHPHLLRVRELVSTERETVLVLDYAAGGSLAVLLRRRGRLRPGEVVTVLAPVAAALAHVHDEGLVHGDISPANVLFTADGRPLLADLGVARVLGERDDPHSTPGYMDPAVAAGAAPGAASDVFMVAAVAAHALTGAPPWRAESPEQAVALAAAGRVPDLRGALPEVPEPLVSAVQRALSAGPSARGSAAELALDMRHACTPEPVGLVLPVGSSDRVGHTDDVGSTGAVTHAVRVPRVPAASAKATRVSAGTPRHRRDDHRRPGPRVGDGAKSEEASGWFGGRIRSVRHGIAAAVALSLAALMGVAWGSTGSGDRPADLATTLASVPDPSGGSPPSGTPPPAAPRSPGSPRPPAAGWREIVEGLDRTRAQAYARGDTRLLGRVYVAGQHLRIDSIQLRALASAGETADGVRHQLISFEVLAASKDHVRLRVVQSLLPSRRMHGGHAVAVIPATAATAVVMDLVATAAGWRLA